MLCRTVDHTIKARSFPLNIMFRLATLSLLCLALSACETYSPPSEDSIPFRSVDGAWRGIFDQTLQWQWSTSGSPRVGYHGGVQLRNTSQKKAHVVGVVSRNPNPVFIDMKQPGAFERAIYPGDWVNVWYESISSLNDTIHILIQDVAYTE